MAPAKSATAKAPVPVRVTSGEIGRHAIVALDSLPVGHRVMIDKESEMAYQCSSGPVDDFLRFGNWLETNTVDPLLADMTKLFQAVNDAARRLNAKEVQIQGTLSAPPSASITIVWEISPKAAIPEAVPAPG